MKLGPHEETADDDHGSCQPDRGDHEGCAEQREIGRGVLALAGDRQESTPAIRP
ncbi:MAG: hypothetical protein U5K37_06600 [Natrialbaceae archaeon]|nr:hypothetical protein [Natrialbaceae archaeon]